MKLNIYKSKNEIEKTYEADSYDVMWGTLEDLSDALKLDELKTEEDLKTAVLNLATNSVGKVRELMKDVFDGITDEEMKRTKVKEVGRVILDLAKYTITELRKGFGSKN